jgi:uncharacterized protein (TIGR02246 family)
VFLKYDEAFNKNDTAALAALFTEDGVFVTLHDGTFQSRRAIERYAVADYQRWHSSDLVHTVDRLIADGNEVLAIGKYRCAFHDTDGTSKYSDAHYSWTLVQEGDTWKIREDDAYGESVSDMTK